MVYNSTGRAKGWKKTAGLVEGPGSCKVSYACSPNIKSNLSNSNSLGDRKNIRIIKCSNCRDSNNRIFLFGDFQGN